MPRSTHCLATVLLMLLTLMAAGCEGAGRDEPPAGSDAGGLRPDDVVYGVVPDLWGGGRLGAAEAVRRRIPYLDDLGVTVLWLWPPAQPREEGEEYAVTAFRGIDPSWGSESEMRHLVEAAHQRGLRVIVDVVVNHTSREHPWWRDHPARYETGADAHYFDWRHLPNLALDHPDVQAGIRGGLAWWVTSIGVDGFRFDVAWGPQRRSPDFWPGVVEQLRALDRDLFLLAEAGPHDWVEPAGFDAAYDWKGGLGRWAWSEVWKAEAPGEALAALVAEPSPLPVLRFLDNNDTGRRFADRHGTALAARAGVVELTVPGVPTVFAGQELGLAYEPYDVGEHPPAWRDHGLLELYRVLVPLRREQPALTGAELEVLAADATRLTYLRPGDRPVVVAVDLAEGVVGVPRLPEAAVPHVGRHPEVLVSGPGYAVWSD